MSKNIYLHEVRSRLKSVLTWSLAALSVAAIFFSFFSTFADQAVLVNQMLENFPPELRTAFGMGGIDFTTVLGYFSFLILFIMLFLAIQAGNYGFGLVSIEENELTADFLLTRPVSRTRVLTSKLLAALTSLLLTNLVVWASSFGVIAIFKGKYDYEPGTLALLLFGVMIFQLFFLGVGLLISLLVKRVRSVTPYSLGLAFGMYVLSAFSGVFGDVKLELITPFKHFDPVYIVENQSLNAPLVLLNLAVTLLAVALSYVLYLRRDIPSVS